MIRINFILLIFVFTVPAGAETITQKDFCFEKYGQAFDVDPIFLEAISFVESHHKPNAINVKSSTSIAYGHMQIHSYWIDPILGDQYENLDDACFCTAIGAYILRDCLDRNSSQEDVLSCYNSGKSLDLLTSDTRKSVERYITLVQERFLELKQSPKTVSE